jgi:tRNA pseudouridine38-40 synthase
MTNHRLLCTVAYDGTYYAGFQRQPHVETIQGQLEKALSALHKKPIDIAGTGRTDAGVHARGQAFHFDTHLPIPLDKWPQAINSLLNRDIRIQRVYQVKPSFHARYNASQKEYRYFVYQRHTEDPIRRLHQVHVPYSLNIPRMREAAASLLGTHDFSNFCSAGTHVQNKIRTIYKAEIEIIDNQFIQQDEERTICFSFIGDGFLYHMVRLIVGTLLKIGCGKLPSHAVQEALKVDKDTIEQRNNQIIGPTAPAHGLYLWEIRFPDDELRHEQHELC